MVYKKDETLPNNLLVSVIFLFMGVLLFYFISVYIWIPDLTKDIFKSDNITIPALRAALLYVYIPMAAYCFIASELTGNYGQIDKVWPIAPILFSWFLAFYCNSNEKNLSDMSLIQNGSYYLKPFLISFLVTIWGLRLMHQFYLKGGYRFPRIWEGKEDYRWIYVRKMPLLANNRTLFSIFNLFFITIYQLTLLFLISGGVILGDIILRYRLNEKRTLSPADYLIAAVLIFLIFLEAASDRQQRQFQVEKIRRIQNDEKLTGSDEHYELGFKTSGLFSYSRHPNFTCEQAIWVMFYMFTIDFGSSSLIGVGGWFNFSVVGCLSLIFLFLKSTDLTEDISSTKYPAYVKYQKNVARIVDLKLVARKFFLGENPDRSWINQL